MDKATQDERRDNAIQRMVAKAPPLTPQQATRLAAILTQPADAPQPNVTPDDVVAQI